jgi:hypothetical protein
MKDWALFSDIMTTQQHNKAEENMMIQLFERERWILGEQIGRDPRESWRDMAILENRISQIILTGFGQWMADQIK